MLVDKSKLIYLMFGGAEIVGEVHNMIGDKIEVKMPLGLVTDHQGNLHFVEFMLGQTPKSVVTFPAGSTSYMIGDDCISEQVQTLYTMTIEAINKPKTVIDTEKPRIQV